MNIRIFAIIAVVLAGVAVLVYSFSGGFSGNSGNESEPSVELSDTGTATTEPEIAAEQIVPTFDVVRLEPDGALLVAGAAQPNSLVELYENEKVLGESRAGASGDFVITPKNNLAPGEYILHLRATNSANQQITSKQTATIYVPANESDEVLVIVNEQGQPSRILSRPSELVADESAESKNVNLQIEAVEVEEKNIYVAGTVNADVLVRLYINNNVLGLARGSAQNRFLLEKQYELESGKHVVRADVIDENDGSVLARVEVDLLHQVDGGSSSAIRTGSHVISIKKGDTLWHISQKFYGSGFRYTTIYNANRDQIVDPDLIYVGQVFKVPEGENE